MPAEKANSHMNNPRDEPSGSFPSTGWVSSSSSKLSLPPSASPSWALAIRGSCASLMTTAQCKHHAKMTNTRMVVADVRQGMRFQNAMKVKIPHDLQPRRVEGRVLHSIDQSRCRPASPSRTQAADSERPPKLQGTKSKRRSIETFRGRGAWVERVSKPRRGAVTVTQERELQPLERTTFFRPISLFFAS